MQAVTLTQSSLIHYYRLNKTAESMKLLPDLNQFIYIYGYEITQRHHVDSHKLTGETVNGRRRSQSDELNEFFKSASY